MIIVYYSIIIYYIIIIYYSIIIIYYSIARKNHVLPWDRIDPERKQKVSKHSYRLYIRLISLYSYINI